ncbi:hypothetical protein BKA83DRAFT_4127003 [Pisolithus microcarpus]|nr:hypothetical protein BKA83DRAFT_4127003 [Pisolithus microcarpus]
MPLRSVELPLLFGVGRYDLHLSDEFVRCPLENSVAANVCGVSAVSARLFDLVIKPIGKKRSIEGMNSVLLNFQTFSELLRCSQSVVSQRLCEQRCSAEVPIFLEVTIPAKPNGAEVGLQLGAWEPSASYYHRDCAFDADRTSPSTINSSSVAEVSVFRSPSSNCSAKTYQDLACITLIHTVSSGLSRRGPVIVCFTFDLSTKLNMDLKNLDVALDTQLNASSLSACLQVVTMISRHLVTPGCGGRNLAC